jgi:Zn-finger nucleic acid-binding protein
MSPRQEWQGPFTLAELAVLPWLSPLTWVTKTGGQSIDRAWQDPDLSALLLLRLSGREQATSGMNCPMCHQPLQEAAYEGTQVLRCRSCAGTLVENTRINRIIARTGRDRRCTERINALARTTIRQNQARRLGSAHRMTGKAAVPLLPCPKCGNPMLRGFYSLTHLVEVDRCSFCGITWFDQHELEILQCLIENRLVPAYPAAGDGGHGSEGEALI